MASRERKLGPLARKAKNAGDVPAIGRIWPTDGRIRPTEISGNKAMHAPAGGVSSGPKYVSQQLGRKDDGADGRGSAKPDWSLIPFDALSSVVEVLTFGSKKYGPDNWVHVKNARRRYFAAALRHLVAWYRGEESDPETGLSHLAHAMCCLLFLLGITNRKRAQRIVAARNKSVVVSASLGEWS